MIKKENENGIGFIGVVGQSNKKTTINNLIKAIAENQDQELKYVELPELNLEKTAKKIQESIIYLEPAMSRQRKK